MRWYWQLEPRGLLKLIKPLIVRMGRRQEQTIWTGLKHYLEEQKTPVPQVQDLLAASKPKEFAEFRETVKPRNLHVFFGALDPPALGISERLLRRLPAGRALLPEGDFVTGLRRSSWQSK